MALIQTFTYVRSDDYTSIVVTDTTGLYNATTNPGGYGGVNPAEGDFTTFDISIYLPDAETLLPSTTAVVVDAYSALPSDSNGTFTLTSLVLLGVADTVLVDGVYQFGTSAIDSGGAETEYTTTTYVAYYQIVECCIDNMIAETVGCGCSGDSKKIQSLSKAIVNLYALSPKVVNEVITLSPLASCGLWEKAATAILELQDICDNENCGGCNGCN